MRTYEFTLVLAGVDVMTADLAEQLYEAGCDDATPGSSQGVVRVLFSREAESYESAIRSAIANVMAAGCTVARVQIESDAPLLRI